MLRKQTGVHPCVRRRRICGIRIPILHNPVTSKSGMILVNQNTPIRPVVKSGCFGQKDWSLNQFGNLGRQRCQFLRRNVHRFFKRQIRNGI